jgi:hypothetical protein
MGVNSHHRYMGLVLYEKEKPAIAEKSRVFQAD